MRPTSDRVREAVFNALASLDVIEDATVADLFAGTGALGIEALSRGARSVVFVERDRSAVACLRANLSATGLDGSAQVVAYDVERWLDAAPPVDLALVDPPYAYNDWRHLLARLRAGVAVLESNRPIKAPPGWEAIKDRRYGGTFVTVLAGPLHLPSASRPYPSQRANDDAE